MSALKVIWLDDGIGVRGTLDPAEAVAFLNTSNMLAEWGVDSFDYLLEPDPHRSQRQGHHRIVPSRGEYDSTLVESKPGRGAFPAVVWWF